MELDLMKVNGCLSITTENGQSKVKIKGTGKDILFNLTALTYQVCRKIGIPVELLCRDLPAAVRDYEQQVIRKCKSVETQIPRREEPGREVAPDGK